MTTAVKLGLVAGFGSYPFLAEVRLEGAIYGEDLGGAEEQVSTRALVLKAGLQF